MFMEEEHKVIVVGLDNAGKTTILYQLSMNEVIHTRFGFKGKCIYIFSKTTMSVSRQTI